MKSIYIMLAALCLVAIAYWPSDLGVDHQRTVMPSGAVSWMPYDMPLANYMGDGDANFVIARLNSQVGVLYGSEYSHGEDNMFKPYRWSHHRPVQRFVMLIPLSILVLLIGYCHLHPKREEVYQPVTPLTETERSAFAKVLWTLLGLTCLVAYGVGVSYTIDATLYASSWVVLTSTFAIAIGFVISLCLVISQVEEVWNIDYSSGNASGSSDGSSLLLMTTMMMSNTTTMGRH